MQKVLLVDLAQGEPVPIDITYFSTVDELYELIAKVLQRSSAEFDILYDGMSIETKQLLDIQSGEHASIRYKSTLAHYVAQAPVDEELSTEENDHLPKAYIDLVRPAEQKQSEKLTVLTVDIHEHAQTKCSFDAYMASAENSAYWAKAAQTNTRVKNLVENPDELRKEILASYRAWIASPLSEQGWEKGLKIISLVYSQNGIEAVRNSPEFIKMMQQFGKQSTEQLSKAKTAIDEYIQKYVFVFKTEARQVAEPAELPIISIPVEGVLCAQRDDTWAKYAKSDVYQKTIKPSFKHQYKDAMMQSSIGVLDLGAYFEELVLAIHKAPACYLAQMVKNFAVFAEFTFMQNEKPETIQELCTLYCQNKKLIPASSQSVSVPEDKKTFMKELQSDYPLCGHDVLATYAQKANYDKDASHKLIDKALYFANLNAFVTFNFMLPLSMDDAAWEEFFKNEYGAFLKDVLIKDYGSLKKCQEESQNGVEFISIKEYKLIKQIAEMSSESQYEMLVSTYMVPPQYAIPFQTMKKACGKVVNLMQKLQNVYATNQTATTPIMPPKRGHIVFEEEEDLAPSGGAEKDSAAILEKKAQEPQFTEAQMHALQSLQEFAPELSREQCVALLVSTAWDISAAIEKFINE